jgi:hypothetical protein
VHAAGLLLSNAALQLLPVQCRLCCQQCISMALLMTMLVQAAQLSLHFLASSLCCSLAMQFVRSSVLVALKIDVSSGGGSFWWSMHVTQHITQPSCQSFHCELGLQAAAFFIV